jgi:hypothetical protein
MLRQSIIGLTGNPPVGHSSILVMPGEGPISVKISRNLAMVLPLPLREGGGGGLLFQGKCLVRTPPPPPPARGGEGYFLPAPLS